MYILVLRDVKAKRSYIWQAKARNKVADKLRRFIQKAAWNAKADTYILENYRVIPTSKIASKCTHILRRPVSRNAVIGRYRDLKKARNAQTIS